MHALKTNNRLLTLLDPGDAELFAPHLTPVDLPLRTVLQEPGGDLQYIHFIENGLGSVVAISGKSEIEVAHLGSEAMTGTEVLNGINVSSHRVLIQIAATGLRIPREPFLDLLYECPSAKALFTRYQEAFVIQVEQTALANGRFTLEQRLARWLLMCQDRVGGDEIHITHEYLALMLGVRRAGVTTALHLLEGYHVVRSVRGLVIVRDRKELENIAGESYGVSEMAYERLVVGAHPERERGASDAIAIH